MQPFLTAREAFTWMQNQCGVCTVLNGSCGLAVPIECSPAQAREALARMNDPWPANCVQALR